jgi:hypothetical protein
MDDDKLPNPAPRYLKLLLGLPSDASGDEVRQQWDLQVIPLLDKGPKVLFQDLVNHTVRAGGIPLDKAWRIVSQTTRGQLLKNSWERESKFRQRAAGALPPFLKPPYLKPQNKKTIL